MSVMSASHATAMMIKIFRSDIEMHPYAIIGDPAMLKQLIRIDIDGHGHVLGEWQFIQCFAHEPAQAHNCSAAEQDVKSKLALQLLQRRRCSIAENKFGSEIFL